MDNASIESFFSHLKTENVYLTSPQTVSELEQTLHDYILFYNNDRFQKKLNNRSPVEYRETAAA
ncbi:hypothetical protein YDYSY3_44760 [Paenibacillus chitinolyticus]|nr:IS3 family transposase [Paenibacillus chitinolyticus]GKS13476.1 hypothetical protein YDYSY3_44760 [Paenibacillus chitinolyticus]